ncbi:hypothetical protein Q0F99_13015 [Rathayibacter oskolensis]|uniref:hypothetical protein n=1 Tax=Rathayibacter oskolensis TaxID=1891671 RepID=UPI00265F5FA2|nr:hypothetical protein [Rathayibacter oskolensis]WKK70712.1 hypothetical protein Q0F99_13015 [Rathayibacter oskolensis]
MHIRSRPLLTAVLAATVLAALTGCVPAADTADPGSGPTASGGAAAPASATPSASGSATPAPGGSATPSPAMADAVSLLIGPTSFSLVDASGTELGTWDYRNGTGAVEALTEAFGSAPTESDDVPYEGSAAASRGGRGSPSRTPRCTTRAGRSWSSPSRTSWSTRRHPRSAMSPSARSAASRSAMRPGTWSRSTPMASRRRSLGLFLFDETTVGSHNGGDLVNSVMAVAEDETTVSRIAAPSANWGV